MLDKMRVTHTHKKKSHITLSDVAVKKDFKCNSCIKKYGNTTGKKNHVKWEDMLRGRGQVSEQKYPDHVV